MLHPKFHKFFLLALIASTTAPALAQQPRPADLPEGIRIDADGVPRFDAITEERVRPDGVPDHDLVERPPALLEQGKLPVAPSEATIKELSTKLHAHTFEIAAELMPPQPYRQVPMIYRGHAVLLSMHEDGSAPVLVTSLEWLRDADAIYLLPNDPKQRSAALPTAKATTLDAMTAGGLDAEEFDAQKHRLTKLKRVAPDTWRGLVSLTPDGNARQRLPSTGLPILDLQKNTLSAVYGYSPATGATPVPTNLMPPPTHDDASLQFFFRSHFPAILGAPLTDQDGHLVGLSAIRHPSQPHISLIIPAGALRAYVAARQKITPPVPSEDKRD
jgi:hypothetical protein